MKKILLVIILFLAIFLSCFSICNSSSYALTDNTIINFDAVGGLCDIKTKELSNNDIIGGHKNILPTDNISNFSSFSTSFLTLEDNIFYFNLNSSSNVVYADMYFKKNLSLNHIKPGKNYTLVFELLEFTGRYIEIHFGNGSSQLSYVKILRDKSGIYFYNISGSSIVNYTTLADCYMVFPGSATVSASFRLSLFEGVVNDSNFHYVPPGEYIDEQLPVPTKNNHTFDGWFTDIGHKVEENSYYSEEYNNLYARWTRLPFDNEYNYSAELSTDYSTTFLEGIKSIESVNFGYYNYYDIILNQSVGFNFIVETSTPLNLPSYHNNLPSLKGLLLRLNQFGYIDNSADCFKYNVLILGDFSCTASSNSGSYKYRFGSMGSCNRIVISNMNLDFNNTNNILPYVSRNYYENSLRYSNCSSDLNSFIDLDSNTNFNFSSEKLFDGSSINGQNIFSFIDKLLFTNDVNYLDSGLICCYGSNNMPSISFNVLNKDGYIHTTTINSLNNSFSYRFFLSNYFNRYDTSKIIVNKKLIIDDFEFVINRPSERLENTLVLYNYDYDCAISSISSIKYALDRNNCLYSATYNGLLPNNRYIAVESKGLQNRLYDNYVYLYLNFNNNIIDFSENTFSLGFDFNFSRYYEPFVIVSNDLITYDLPPLNKPYNWFDFGGWINYGFIWLIFYSPIISPISQFIVAIFGLLINSLRFILGFNLGSFILSFIGFIMLYNFFVSISPIQKIGKGINILDKNIHDDFYDETRLKSKVALKRAKNLKSIQNENKKSELKEFSRLHKEKHINKKRK